MLYIDENSVDMRLAVKDIGAGVRRPSGSIGSPAEPEHTRRPGVWGDATLATREKGRIVVEGVVTDDPAATLRRLRAARPPAPAPAAAPVPASGSPAASALRVADRARRLSSRRRAGHQTCGSRFQCRVAAERPYRLRLALRRARGPHTWRRHDRARPSRHYRESGRAVQDARVPGFPPQSRLHHHPLHQSVGRGR